MYYMLQNVIKPRSVSGAVPCPACILWFAGRMLCSWAAGLILSLVWTWHGKRHIPDSCSLPVAMFIWERGLSSLGGACLCQDIWRALVLKLLSSATVQEGGKGRMEVPLAIIALYPFFLSSAGMDKCLV